MIRNIESQQITGLMAFGNLLTNALHVEAESPERFSKDGYEEFVSLMSQFDDPSADVEDLVSQISKGKVIRMFTLIATHDLVHCLKLLFNHKYIPNTGPNSPPTYQALKNAIRAGSPGVLDFLLKHKVPLFNTENDNDNNNNHNTNKKNENSNNNNNNDDNVIVNGNENGNENEAIVIGNSNNHNQSLNDQIKSIVFTILKAHQIGNMDDKNIHSVDMASRLWDYLAQNMNDLNKKLEESHKQDEVKQNKENKENNDSNENDENDKTSSETKLIPSFEINLDNENSTKNGILSLDSRKIRLFKLLANNEIVLFSVCLFVQTQIVNRYYPTRLLSTIDFLSQRYFLFGYPIKSINVEKKSKQEVLKNCNIFWGDTLFRLIDDLLLLKLFLRNSHNLTDSKDNFSLDQTFGKIKTTVCDELPHLSVIQDNNNNNNNQGKTNGDEKENKNNKKNKNNDNKNINININIDTELKQLRLNWKKVTYNIYANNKTGNKSLEMKMENIDNIQNNLLTMIGYLISGQCSENWDILKNDKAIHFKNGLKLFGIIINCIKQWQTEMSRMIVPSGVDTPDIITIIAKLFYGYRYHWKLKGTSKNNLDNGNVSMSTSDARTDKENYQKNIDLMNRVHGTYEKLMKTINEAENDCAMRGWIGNEKCLLISDALCLSLPVQERQKYQLPLEICNMIVSYITLA